MTVADFGCRRSTVEISVDFPLPLSPAMPNEEPAATARSTPRTAGTSPSRPR